MIHDDERKVRMPEEVKNVSILEKVHQRLEHRAAESVYYEV